MKRCKHVWTVLSQETHDSPQEIFAKNGGKSIEVGGDTTYFFVKPVIVHYGCTTCGTEKVERV